MMTAILRKTHGIQARMSCLLLITSVRTADRGFDVVAPPKSHTDAGFQTRQKSASAASDDNPPTMSTSSGPTALLQVNCTMANTPPHTATAGHTPARPLHPLMVTTSHAGTMSDTKGSCRPAIALKAEAGMPVTAARVRIGVPMAPNATGA